MKDRWMNISQGAEEKQEKRLENWLEGKNISFKSQEAEENYRERTQMIKDAIQHSTGRDCELTFEISCTAGTTKSANSGTSQMRLPTENARPRNGHFLRRDFTFDRFVVGDNNDFAYSASLALASRKEAQQNSLFLLSKTGMGKSHLSQAIGNHVLSIYPKERVYYITAENFSNEMVQAYRHDDIDKFKGKYRNQCDVLLL